MSMRGAPANFEHPTDLRETYLGDAVYASFDGWQICLRTGDGGEHIIYLDPEVLAALDDYRTLLLLRQPAEGKP